MPFRVQKVGPGEYAGWDEFVRRHPLASPFHLTAWRRVIEENFGFEPHYLAVWRESRIEAVLPLFLVDNWITGKILVSSPFAVYGGALYETEEARDVLKPHLEGLGKSLGVQYIELRNAYPGQVFGFSPVTRYLTFSREVDGRSGEELIESFPKKTRNMVRKALKSPFRARPGADLKYFYELLSRNYRRLGTPVFPRRYFESILKWFGPEGADVREILAGEEVAAVSLNLLFREQMHTYYAASAAEFLPLAPNNFLYYDHLLWAGQNGYTVFDFGRSKVGSGTADFKKHWDTVARELPYEILLVKRAGMPNFSPQNESFSLAIEAWKRMPLWATRLLGPFAVRLFP
jgi:FemAB-related protein (PEP-CTERM system-associated)